MYDDFYHFFKQNPLNFTWKHCHLIGLHFSRFAYISCILYIVSTTYYYSIPGIELSVIYPSPHTLSSFTTCTFSYLRD